MLLYRQCHKVPLRRMTPPPAGSPLRPGVPIGIAVALLFATVWPEEADVDLAKTNLFR